MRTVTFTVAALFLVLWTSDLVAQEPASVLIRAGRLFDSEAGAFLENQDILVRRSRIAAVGPDLTIPDGGEIIDLRNYTVLPGLIDAHTHLLYLEDPSGSLTTEGLKALLLEGEALRALHGAARARTFLDAGITTVRDLGNSGMFVDRALQRAIQDGSVPGPRMLVSGPGLSPVGGQFPGLLPEQADLAAREYRIVTGPEDAAAAVRENLTFGADVIKIFSNNTPNPGYLSVAEMRAIVGEAEVMGARVAAHATNDRAIWRAVEAGVHSIEHGYQITDSTLRFMQERDVALVPTDLDSLTIVRYMEQTGQSSPARVLSYLRSHRDRLRRAKALGVTIVAGSDAYIDLGVPQGSLARRVLFAYHQAGFTPVEVLLAATLNGAKLLGGEGRIGVIKAGAMADIIALEGDPEDDFDALERVRFVMKAGQVYRRP